MKQALAVFGQFLLFLIVDAVGSLFYQPFHIQSTLSKTAMEQRSFVWDGLILTLLVYLLIIVMEALRKRLPVSAPTSTIALVLASLAGYFMKLGFITHNW